MNVKGLIVDSHFALGVINDDAVSKAGQIDSSNYNKKGQISESSQFVTGHIITMLSKQGTIASNDGFAKGDINTNSINVIGEI